MGNTAVRELHRSIAHALEAAGQNSGYAADANEPDPQYKSYGARAAAKRAIFTDHRSRIASLGAHEAMGLVVRLVASGYGEQQGVGIEILAGRLQLFHEENLYVLDELIRRLHGWSKIDGFTGAVMPDLVFRYPDRVLPLVRSWSRDTDLWPRRASIVLFTRKVAKSGRFTDMGLEIATRLASDPELMVQKGVGWALKDMMRSDEDRIIRIVKELREAGAPSVVTLYAIRNLEPQKRRAVLAVRPRRSDPCRRMPQSCRNLVSSTDSSIAVMKRPKCGRLAGVGPDDRTHESMISADGREPEENEQAG